MKHAGHLSLVCSILVFSLLATAQEAGQSTVPVAPDAAAPDGLQWLGKYKSPYSDLGTQVRVFGRAKPLVAESRTCYFIQTLRPVPASEAGNRLGFLLLQSRATGIVREPVCTTPDRFQPLIPVNLKIAASSR